MRLAPGKSRGRWRAGPKRARIFFVARAGFVGFEGQGFATVFNDGEFVNQPFKFSDEVGGNEDRAPAGIGFLIRADDRFNEFAPNDWVQAGSWFVKDEQLRFGADSADQGELCFLAFGQGGGLLGFVEAKLVEEVALGFAVPLLAKGRADNPAYRARSSTGKTPRNPARTRGGI